MTIKLLPDNAEGYPLLYIVEGCPLCAECMTEAVNNGDVNPLEAVGSVYWEGETLHCEDCNALIESAYGNPEE